MTDYSMSMFRTKEEMFAAMQEEIERLRAAHERISAADQRSINVWSAAEALAWCHAVSEEALKGGEA